ncbi:hypothetical protein DFH29DRAFT_993828 [Suillus ampliporus]|nr:hypothetical protein DFH29DRAFT_993828 [Suillus ampliporus]
MASIEDNQFNYSSTDWKAKYNEVADMLTETRAELDEFHTSSKELEEELIKEIDRTEKAQQDLKVKVAKTELDRDEWKSKFISLQTTHNTTTTSLQRELDTVRQESQKLKVRLRDLELGNDDLERNERVVASSLADIETRYSKALEEKILLEHELLDKAHMEEELQRVKDELRDASVEISILKDQLSAARTSSRAPSITTETSTSTTPSSLFPPLSTPSTDDNLLSTPPPPDLELSELSSHEKSSIPTPSRPPSTSVSSHFGQSILLQRAGFQKPNPNTSSPSSITRSSTLPTLAASRNSPRTAVPVPRPTVVTASSSASTNITAIPMTASKSKGVQMVSEMRARVRNLEQKIHTRVPRLRMGSNAGRQGTNAISTMASTSTISSTLAPKSPFPRSVMPDSKLAKPTPQRLGVDTGLTSGVTTPNPDNSGWVLIMDDTPSPNKDAEKEHRRSSSPSAPSAFRRGVPPSASSPTFSKPSHFTQSTMAHSRRPQSRLSAASLCTTATISSIPTPSSRPATPTFLPIPTSRLYSNTGATGFKKSTGPGAGPYSQPKRSSIGSSNTGSPTPSSDGEFRPRERPFSYNGKVQSDLKSLPQLPLSHSNVTVRASSRIPSSASSASVLSQSRIGRPAGITGGRKSGGLEPHSQDNGGFLEPDSDKKPRGRSGSNMLNFGRGGA